jgi:hypothetical protein
MTTYTIEGGFKSREVRDLVDDICALDEDGWGIYLSKREETTVGPPVRFHRDPDEIQFTIVLRRDGRYRHGEWTSTLSELEGRDRGTT